MNKTKNQITSNLSRYHTWAFIFLLISHPASWIKFAPAMSFYLFLVQKLKIRICSFIVFFFFLNCCGTFLLCTLYSTHVAIISWIHWCYIQNQDMYQAFDILIWERWQFSWYNMVFLDAIRSIKFEAKCTVENKGSVLWLTVVFHQEKCTL